MFGHLLIEVRFSVDPHVTSQWNSRCGHFLQTRSELVLRRRRGLEEIEDDKHFVVKTTCLNFHMYFVRFLTTLHLLMNEFDISERQIKCPQCENLLEMRSRAD